MLTASNMFLCTAVVFIPYYSRYEANKKISINIYCIYHEIAAEALGVGRIQFRWLCLLLVKNYQAEMINVKHRTQRRNSVIRARVELTPFNP